MTFNVISTAIIGSGAGLTLTNGDQLQILPGGSLVSTANYGVISSGNCSIQIAGSLGGASGAYSGMALAGYFNNITIAKTGYLFAGAGSNGIYIYGAGTHQIFNAGSIQLTGAAALGVCTSGAGAIVNDASGLISAGQAFVDTNLYAADVYSVLNLGSVVGSSYAFYGSAALDVEILDNAGTMIGGVQMGSNSANVLFNRGAMDSSNSSNGFNLVDTTLSNTGEVYQTVSSSSAVDMITTANHAGDTIYNAGVIAQIHGSASSSAVAFGNGAGDVLSNDVGGIIIGNVKFGSGAGDSVLNNGIINGNVALGAGAGDAYYGQNGHLYGTLICGDGGDYVYSGSGYESVAAGKGNDIFYSGNGGGLVINETAAAQRANALDTVTNFQVAGGVGTGTYLHFDASMASSTFFMSDGSGGTWIAMGLGGGAYSYVDVIGVGELTVQSQTYFA